MKLIFSTDLGQSGYSIWEDSDGMFGIGIINDGIINYDYYQGRFVNYDLAKDFIRGMIQIDILNLVKLFGQV